MSAFIVSPEHIKQLAIFAARKSQGSRNVDPRYLDRSKGLAIADGPTLPIANFYAEILYRQNVRSVGERYEGDDIDNLPGPIHKPANVICTPRDERTMGNLPPIHILKMCDCLAYQSCETEDWEKTKAYELLQMIKDAAIRKLPGYEDAPWDYNDERAAA